MIVVLLFIIYYLGFLYVVFSSRMGSYMMWVGCSRGLVACKPVPRPWTGSGWKYQVHMQTKAPASKIGPVAGSLAES